MFDAQLYRTKDEVEAWRKKDPIDRFQHWLEENSIIHPDEAATMIQAVQAEIADAVAFSEAGTWEPVEDLTKHVYSFERPAPPAPSTASSRDVVQTTYREAVRDAVREALLRDDRVFLMGEDVGRYGGCYAVSKGLLAEFGPERILDTPSPSRASRARALGPPLPACDQSSSLMTVNFSLLALDQILNTAATIRHMSGNQFGVPLVIRMATGAGRQLAAQHSHSLEGWYAHIPGIRVLAPATLEDARGMLWTALQEPDPVLIFENVMLYNRSGALAADAGAVDIDRAVVRRPGRDISLITYGGSLWKTLEAADELARDGIEAEVIDLRVLRPLDTATITTSVAKTRRAVIIDEGWRTGSLAAEIGMRLVEDVFWELDAPLAASAPRRCRSPMRATLRKRRSPKWSRSSRRSRRLCGQPEGRHGRISHALSRRRHGGRDPGGVACQTRRFDQARRHHRRCRNTEGSDRDRGV
ncbi:transketolase C-terminal domain-containing protein [Methylobacterium sp. P31]